MTLFQIGAILLSLAALFSYLNARFIGLPTSIAVMAFSLAFSLGMVLLSHTAMGDLSGWAEQLVRSVDFDQTVLQGMLSFLLFAGALHVDLEALAEQKWIVGVLASVGVVLTTFLVGAAMYYVLGWLGLALPLAYCLLLGAILAPTDPIAVLAMLKSMGAPETLSTKIAGESLFNDGVAVVVFLAISGIALGEEAGVGEVGLLFLEEVVGGVVLGLVLGGLGYYLLRSVDNYQVEALLTLALAAGGYALASALHMSGPLAVVVAGLLIGNHGRRLAMSHKTREHLDNFWELVDEVLNAILFLLVGLEVLIIAYDWPTFWAGLAAIPLVLLARLVAVGLPVTLMRPFQGSTQPVVLVMTWGGLKGGISVALALSLPGGPERDVLLGVTYVVVVFSILVQGLTVEHLVRRKPQRS